MTAAVARDGAASPPLLDLSGVVVTFDGVRAVDGVSFGVASGSLTGLIGPNGAGKSTLLGAICGTIVPREGTIALSGLDLTGLPAYAIARRGVTRTFQSSSEFGRLTVLENLLVGHRPERGERFSRVLLGPWAWRREESIAIEKARALLARFGLQRTENQYAGELSGGQRRIVELLRALMSDPLLLVLDEPMAGVHPRVAAEIAECLERLRDEGLTILMTEHELGFVERLCEPVVVMAQGRIISEGSLHDLRQDQDVLDAYLVG